MGQPTKTGPLGLYMANMAEEEGVPYRLFENEDALNKDELDDKHVLKVMKLNNPSMFQLLQEKARKALRDGKVLPEDVDQAKGFIERGDE